MTIADKLQIILNTRDELSTNIINGTDYTSLSNVPFSQYPSLLEDAKINYANEVASLLAPVPNSYTKRYSLTLSNANLQNSTCTGIVPYGLFYSRTISSVTFTGPAMSLGSRFTVLCCASECCSNSNISNFNVNYDISQLDNTSDAALSNVPTPEIRLYQSAFRNSKLSSFTIKVSNFPDGYNPEDDDYARFPNLRPIVYIQNYASCFYNAPIINFPFKSLSAATLPAYMFYNTGIEGVTDKAVEDGGTGLIADLSSGPYISSLSSIAQLCFSNCHFYKIYIGDGVTTIGNSAFRYSTAKAIYLGNSVDSIGSLALANTSSLLSCVFMGDVPTTLNNNILSNNTTCTVYVSRAYPNWETYITDGTFYGRPIEYFD